MIAESAGEMGWFQLYAPRDRDLMRDLLRRAKAAATQRWL
jgi:isopentenyl diphosphate isomerase/L-lactate dehydrogenase-like FMN-dependent dehydrogenase